MTLPSASPSSYSHKLILAPMVRLGTIPLRLMALKYGADLVYSPEIIDKKLLICSRQQNPILGTVDFVENQRQNHPPTSSNKKRAREAAESNLNVGSGSSSSSPLLVSSPPPGKVCLRVHPKERGKLILQLGTSDPDLAVKAALIAVNDVAGIDVNCGCPKKFSISGGMGAALLSNPDKLIAILTALVEKVPLPITCKIRLLSSIDETCALIERIEATGVSAITVHTRTRDERPQDKAHMDVLYRLSRAVKRIPLIANGDFFDAGDLQVAKDLGAHSFMIARAAQWNVTVFGPMHHKMKEMYGNLYRKEDDDDQYPSPPTSVSSIWSTIREYVSLAIETDMAFQNTKYCISTMMSSIAHDRISVIRPPPHETTMKFSSFSAALLESVPVGGEWCFKFSEGVHAARSLKDIALFVGVMDRYEEIMEARRKRIEELSVSTSSQVDGCNADVSLENKNDFAVGAVSSSTFGLLITPETSALYDSELPYMPNASFIPESKRVKLEGVPEIVVEKKKEE